MNRDRYLVVVSGPSGCGKDTIVREMRRVHPEIELSVSATSRPMRAGETEGVDYYYMSRQDFLEKIQADEMLEYAEYGGNYYGTPKAEVDKRLRQGCTVVLVIEVEGAENIRRLYPEATTVFLLPPSMEELEARLRGRGTESEESIARRMARARQEIECAPRYTCTLVNDEVTACAARLYQIIQERQQG